jgi:two-component system chemotaxis response regulator CheB
MPALLASLAREPAGEAKPLARSIQYEVEIARSGQSDMDHMDEFGRRSVLGCPDCGGVMWEIDEGERAVALPLPRRPYLYRRSDEPRTR